MKMKNAVIYARYSSDKQNEMSIEGQIEECKRYAAATLTSGKPGKTAGTSPAVFACFLWISA